MTAVARSSIPATVPAAPTPRRIDRPPMRVRLFGPGWPFVWFFVGYPVWWLFGFTWLAALVACGVMLTHLCRRDAIVVPRHFGWWLLFLAWVGAGVFLLQVDAPGAVPGASVTRYLTWGYRLLTFAEATVMLVYLCTFRREMHWVRVSKALGWMFAYIAIGGLLGVVAPFTQFPSLFELILPRHISHQPFISSLIHPSLTQIQDYLGTLTIRPSAPFPYANAWGLNYVCFLPFFIAGWWQHGGRIRRSVCAVILLVSSVPLVLSLNRAVWGVVVALLLYVAVRGAIRGHVRLAVACMLVACIGGATLAATPLGGMIQSRLAGDEHTSDQGRANLGALTAASTWDRSAVAGYGTTRDVQGSFRSIAVGTTASCPSCSGPALGTQGIVWLLVFAFGFGGLLLYLGFLLLQFIGSMRSRAPSALLANTTLLAYLLTAPFYDLSLTSQIAAFTAVAFLVGPHRSRDAVHSTDAAPVHSRDARYYTGLLRRQTPLILVSVCCGLIVGAGWQYQRGTPYVASISVVIGSDTSVHHGPRPMSLDTVAQLAGSHAVTSSMQRAVPSAGDITAASLHVSAAPNSRILQLSFSGSSAQQSRRAVSAAASSLLTVRSGVLQAQQKAKLDILDSQDALLRQSMSATSSGIRALQGPGSSAPLRNALITRRSASFDELIKNVGDRANVSLEPVDAGRILRPAHVVRDTQQWKISLVSGALLGLLAGTVLGRLRERRSLRLATFLKHDGDRRVLPPVLATLRTDGDSLSYRPTIRVLERIPDVTCISVGQDPRSCAAANLITARLPISEGRSAPHLSVALVAHSRCRTKQVKHAAERLSLQGARVCGLIVLDSSFAQKMRPSKTAGLAFVPSPRPSRGPR